MSAKNAHANGAWIGICGELAADTTLTETFLRMGIDELSVSPAFVLKVRDACGMWICENKAKRNPFKSEKCCCTCCMGAAAFCLRICKRCGIIEIKSTSRRCQDDS